MNKKILISLLFALTCIFAVAIIFATSTLTEETNKMIEETFTTLTEKIEEPTIIFEKGTESTTETTTIKETTTEHTTIKEETTSETSTENKKEKRLLGTFKITGYTAEEGFGYGSDTASGVGCRPGICAMNRFEMRELGISYGDYIYVEGLGKYQVADCTADRITNTVDIWVYTNAEAYSITGYREVYIYG